MLYAKVVMGISVEGPFDYSVPAAFEKDISVGSRVRVTLRKKKCIGYVVGLSRDTDIEKVLPISALIDKEPLIDKSLLSLTRELSDYYCSSWGEAIETALPQGLRQGKTASFAPQSLAAREKEAERRNILLLQDEDGGMRWDFYIVAIKEELSKGRETILLLPDVEKVRIAREVIGSKTGIDPVALFRKEAGELREWLKIKEGKARIIVGTRSAIFAPCARLGLVILEDEDAFPYKQDQTPHYHAREVAFMRCRLERAGLILGSHTPSLESLNLAREGKIAHVLIPRQSSFPQVTLLNSRNSPRQARKKESFLSRPLEEGISQALSEKSKVLLFLNRKGFATSARCSSCGASFRCPRCDINLVYHFKEAELSCHYCNYRIPAPKVCPECKLGYIKYSGAGTEKFESELSRIFPGSRVEVVSERHNLNMEEADIFIATESILGKDIYFDLSAVPSIDNSLNRIDLRSGEKAFRILNGLLAMTRKKLFIQTSLPHHHAFTALLEKDTGVFYTQELKQRRQLRFPPYSHLAAVKVRGRKESAVKEASSLLFERLKERNKSKGVKVMALRPSEQEKLRGNFYWQILISSKSAEKISVFLKKNLRDFRHSGIIVTVDIDPL